MKVLSDREKALVVIRKIKPQFPSSQEGQLMLAVIEQALKDLVSKKCEISARASAETYLTGYMAHAEVCGVDSGWITFVARRAGLLGNG